MSKVLKEGRTWIIWLTIVAVILAAVGIFFYYSMFKQSETDLIELVPVDAVYVMEINDFVTFTEGSTPLMSNLNDMFALDAFPAFQTICSKIHAFDNLSTISGHENSVGLSILFNLKADKSTFKRLLRELNIDPNNYKSFENNKIYTYGTNYKSIKFAFLNNVIVFSEDVELLKRALIQQKHPKKIFSNKYFKRIYEITTKNRKQNWLILNHELYNKYLSTFFIDSADDYIDKLVSNVDWGAYQIRFSGTQILLSGYVIADDYRFSSQNGDGFTLLNYVPSSSLIFSDYEIPSLNVLKNILSITDNSAEVFSDNNLPSELATFTINKDSTTRRFVSLLADTSLTLSNFLSSISVNLDTISQISSDGYYAIPQRLSNCFMNICKDTMRFATEFNNTFILANSKEDIVLYKKLISKNESVLQNLNYKISSESVASTATSLRTIKNDKNANDFQFVLSEKGKNSKFGNSIRAISLSCNPTDGDYLPINIHLAFLP